MFMLLLECKSKYRTSIRIKNERTDGFNSSRGEGKCPLPVNCNYNMKLNLEEFFIYNKRPKD